MFDQPTTPQGAASPVGAPQGNVEDIFADTEKAGAPAGSAASVPPPLPIESRGGLFGGKLLWVILGGVVLVVLVGGGLYLALRGGGEAALPTPQGVGTPTPAMPDVGAVAEPTPVPVLAPEASPSAVAPSIDTDNDGLPDSEEASAGTNPLIADTDGDGLSDTEEIRTYKTNPLSPDTDGDSFTDGGEVKAGYNPNGAGKLTP